jgi:hypothetical protein
MRFSELPIEYKKVAVEFLRGLKRQDEHFQCFHRNTDSRSRYYRHWEQNRNCDIDIVAQDGHCKHGTYVGGCGIDWMCGLCESDVTDYEWAIGVALDKYRRDMKEKANEEFDKLIAYFNENTYDRENPEHTARLATAMDLAKTYRL